MKQTKRTFTIFRKVAWFEGLSYIALLFIAMPMKYLMDMPLAVRIVGSIHGALFIAFMVYMYLMHDEYGKDKKWIIKAFLASIIPFGTLLMEKEWKQEESLV